jgi:hypothetical protein
VLGSSTPANHLPLGSTQPALVICRTSSLPPSNPSRVAELFEAHIHAGLGKTHLRLGFRRASLVDERGRCDLHSQSSDFQTCLLLRA